MFTPRIPERMPPVPPLTVTAVTSSGELSRFQFVRSFKIGRLKDCDVCVENSYVSRAHAEGAYTNGVWTIRDLGSSNGLFHGGNRVPSIQVIRPTVVKLGIDGPELKFEVEEEHVAKKPPPPQDATLAHYINRYFSKSAANEPMGEHTMYIRQAFAHVETKRKRRSRIAITGLVGLILLAGLFALREHQQLLQQRATAEELFYTIKSQDVDLANLDRALANSNSQAGAEEISKFRNRRQEMETNYDRYLATLHIYNPKLTEQQRIVLRIARIFGECELDMPPGFEAEIDRYIQKWKSSGRLKSAIQIAQQNGYTETIARDLLARGLPPQFFYLALQESNFNPYAVGPMTRKGYAKGMWQFVPETAVKYNLRLGPLVDQQRPDPGDERHNLVKESNAAARYIQDLYGTDAQASGFLVMACYNWGENQILPLIQSMPPNPRERNFWKLLSKHRDRIPQETYDYVFSIASAAAIGENPRLFGFDFDNPLVNLNAYKMLASGPGEK
jgi:peptidoglycan lytic transglycosylase D